jgi:hypothetical protein
VAEVLSVLAVGMGESDRHCEMAFEGRLASQILVVGVFLRTRNGKADGLSLI